MNPKFEYYFQADPIPSKPVYALYDVMDKHFMIQSHNYNVLYQLMYSMRSKTYLEMVVMPNRPEINNSNIETWYITNLPAEWFGDLLGIKSNWNPERHLNEWAISRPDLDISKSNTEFNEFKIDLQKQMFFFYHCLEFLDKTPSDLVTNLIVTSIEQSNNYTEVLDTMLNNVSINSPLDRITFYDFIRQVGICYE